MNKQPIALCHVNEGENAKVKNILSFGSIRRRLQDIGLIEGTEIKCLLKSASGDPIAFFIRGAVIALRTEDSSQVIVETL